MAVKNKKGKYFRAPHIAEKDKNELDLNLRKFYWFLIKNECKCRITETECIVKKYKNWFVGSLY